MDFFNKLKKPDEGGYIFLSHSHDDIDIVREIRNSLEKEGFEPLCFYLKCLNDDSEIEDLIKREIDAREWFVFVNSANSRKSKWVRLEREYITKTDSKKILTIDIDDENSINNVIDKMRHNLRIFMSYLELDSSLARKITRKLKEKDYLVYFDEEGLGAGISYFEHSANAIVEASKEGCVIALITENSIKSPWVKGEILYAVNEGGNIIPVVVGDVKLDEVLHFLLANRKMYLLPENPSCAEINKMIDEIGKSITNRSE